MMIHTIVEDEFKKKRKLFEQIKELRKEQNQIKEQLKAMNVEPKTQLNRTQTLALDRLNFDLTPKDFKKLKLEINHGGQANTMPNSQTASLIFT